MLERRTLAKNGFVVNQHLTSNHILQKTKVEILLA